MDIFISWSGPRSGALAEALKKWLPKIVNAFKPWLSSADIDKGTRWGSEVASKLSTSKAGIICLTPNNLNSQWILFEAGALSKTLENTFVCPLLIGLETSDVTGPLAQFQTTKATREQILPLLKTLNRALGDAAMPETHIEEAFEVWWPKLEAEIKSLPEDGPSQRPHRTDRELLEEIVDSVRGTNAQREELLKEAAMKVGELSERILSLEAMRTRSYSLRDLDGFVGVAPANAPTNALKYYVEDFEVVPPASPSDVEPPKTPSIPRSLRRSVRRPSASQTGEQPKK